MARKAAIKSAEQGLKPSKPAMTPEARENQLIALATDLAEKQLREGTASSQVITHYLKLGTTRERIEKEILEKQKDLIVAKTESVKASDHFDELCERAMHAFQRYSGNIVDDEDTDIS